MQKRNYPGLDSLRALAALGVVATHVAFYSGAYSDSLVGTALARLDIGVAVFFVLSGFLLGRPYVLSALGQGRHDSAGRYLCKRALRILPVYWITIVVAMLAFAQNRELPFSRWLTNLTLTDVFISDQLPRGLSQMWSLSIEAAFYLALPVLVWFGTRLVRGQWTTRSLYVANLAMCAFSIVWVALANSLLKPLFELTAWWLPSYLLWFGVGLILAVASTQLEAKESRLSSSLRIAAESPGTCWLIAGALFIIASTPLAGPTSLTIATSEQQLAKLVLYALIAMLVVLPSALGRTTGRYYSVMANPVLRHLGHISYCLFCCHQMLLLLIAEHGEFALFDGHGLQLMLLTLVSSLLVAEALHWGVERPVQRWRNLGAVAKRETMIPSDRATKN